MKMLAEKESVNMLVQDLPVTARIAMSQCLQWTELVLNVLEEYLASTSLHGYRYLTEPGRHWVERLLWLIVHVVAIWGVVMIIQDVWNEFINTPTVTTVESTHFPIWHVPFPAVAVCNLNKLSLKATYRVAEDLAASRNMSTKYIFNELRYLGRLYDNDITDVYHLRNLHKILQGNSSTYNITSIMHKVSPSCEELLVRCMWLGQSRNCSKLFSMHKSMEGYCCIFNYKRKEHDTISKENSDNVNEDFIKVSSTGFHMGLSVVLDLNPNDYYYPLISSFGAKVLLFNPEAYPDIPSGGLIEKLVPLRNELFFRLKAVTMYSTEGVKAFSIDKRNCLFQSELSYLFDSYYSYSDCLMNCRIRSMDHLCQCVPFYFPTRGDSRECQLRDIECLSQYKEKWSTLRPAGNIQGLEMESEESILCEECLPSCSDTAYQVQTTLAPIIAPHHHHSMLMKGLKTENYSIFHLFFGSFNSVRLKQDVLFYWYDLMSNFGGICSLFVGFSLISIIEFIYFFTWRLYNAYYQNQSKSKSQMNGMQETGIYWEELLPVYYQHHL